MENPHAPKKSTPSDLFRLWADKIDKNSPEDFCGAFLIIPPTGDPISSLLINGDKDVGTFIALVKSKIDDSISAINEAQKRNQGFR